MSKNWYPIIDYDKCGGCLACDDKCTHGVYELNSEDMPKVVNPENCVENCRGCANVCPEDAITYMGDTGEQVKGCGCGCEDDEDDCGCGDDEEDSCGDDGCGCGGCGCC